MEATLRPRLEQGADRLVKEASLFASWAVILNEDGVKIAHQSGSGGLPDRFMAEIMLKVERALKILG